jgi:hypothetical protein
MTNIHTSLGYFHVFQVVEHIPDILSSYNKYSQKHFWKFFLEIFLEIFLERACIHNRFRFREIFNWVDDRRIAVNKKKLSNFSAMKTRVHDYYSTWQRPTRSFIF